jgi:uncharacterized protein (DUF58 family)
VIAAAWRRSGISAFALAGIGMATIAMLLSRGAGSGWLVVLAAAFLGLVAVGVVTAVFGLVGTRVALMVPTDATVGERINVDIVVSSPVPQLRTVTFVNLDGSTHPVNRGRTTLAVRADRRCLRSAITLEVRSGITLGVLRPAARVVVELATPLAIGPRPAPVSLTDAIGFDVAADVRSVRSYVAGDPARLVHWRSTARRGELMVRELEAADQLLGTTLQFRVALSDDDERAEAAASRAAGLAIVALDAGLRVQLLTREAGGQRSGAVTSRREVGRRLAAAVSGDPPPASPGERTLVVEVS